MIYIFCEGETDQEVLRRIAQEIIAGKGSGEGLRVNDLQGDGGFFSKIGQVTKNALQSRATFVFGVLDLYGAIEYPARVRDVPKRVAYLRNAVNRKIASANLGSFAFYPLVHELEALLLADSENLRVQLSSTFAPGPWNAPEEVNFNKPPKQVIKELWTRYRGKRGYYKEHVDCVRLFENADFDVVRKKCPYFDELWRKIESVV